MVIWVGGGEDGGGKCSWAGSEGITWGMTEHSCAVQRWQRLFYRLSQEQRSRSGKTTEFVGWEKIEEYKISIYTKNKERRCQELHLNTTYLFFLVFTSRKSNYSLQIESLITFFQLRKSLTQVRVRQFVRQDCDTWVLGESGTVQDYRDLLYREYRLWFCSNIENFSLTHALNQSKLFKMTASFDVFLAVISTGDQRKCTTLLDTFGIV